MKKLFHRRWYLFLLIFMFGNGVFAERSNLYKNYLMKKNELDARLVCECYFEGATPEEINLALLDIKEFHHDVVCGLIEHNRGRLDRVFLENVLNVHGWLIRYLESAYVSLKTKKVFKQ